MCVRVCVCVCVSVCVSVCVCLCVSVYECARYHNTFLVYLSLGNKVVLLKRTKKQNKTTTTFWRGLKFLCTYYLAWVFVPQQTVWSETRWPPLFKVNPISRYKSAQPSVTLSLTSSWIMTSTSPTDYVVRNVPGKPFVSLVGGFVQNSFDLDPHAQSRTAHRQPVSRGMLQVTVFHFLLASYRILLYPHARRWALHRLCVLRGVSQVSLLLSLKCQ